MNTPALKDRRRLDVGADMILPLLTGLGRIMVIGKQNGATHERIGNVEHVAIADGRARLEGAAHSGEIDLAQIANVTADFSAAMGDKAMPRLEFTNGDAEPVFSIVSLDGREAFDRAFAELPSQQLTETEDAARPERRELAEDDAGFRVLDAIRESGQDVELLLERPGFAQSWQGKVAKVSPGMGFANVMTESFHLHLKGGSVSRWHWDAAGKRLVALDANGAPLGLFVRGPDSVLAALADKESGV